MAYYPTYREGKFLMPPERKPKLVKIDTDESGHLKVVTFDGVVLPVMELTLDADAKSPVATVKLTMLAEANMTAAVGKVGLFCPVCEEIHEHQCYDNPREANPDDYSDDPRY